MTYFVTTPIDSHDLAEAVAANQKQDVIVMMVFRLRGCAMSPSDVHKFGQGLGLSWLLTSVRRSMHTLAKAGALVHLEQSKAGPYGRPETLWGLPVSVPVQLAMSL